MRKMLLLTLALAASSAALLSPAAAKPSSGACVTFCSTPNPCGYVCCYQECCGRLCHDLSCAPPPPCGIDN